MNIESHVLNLELSKKLQSLGVKQESLFSWDDGIIVLNENTSCNSCSAFTASELLELLQIKDTEREVLIIKNAWSEIDYGVHTFEDEHLPNTIAKKLIFLIENNLLETKSC